MMGRLSVTSASRSAGPGLIAWGWEYASAIYITTGTTINIVEALKEEGPG